MAENIHDLIIIGAGPAGLAASIYASRYGLEHKLIGSLLGGQISETHHIDNYPGLEDMTGFEFSQRWGKHVNKYGVEILPEKVSQIVKADRGFVLTLENGNTVLSKTILLATGTKRRRLGLPSEEQFIGKGVSYCATCDGFFYRQKTVAVIGGSDSAAGAAAYLSNICEKVFLIYRQESLRCEVYWQKAIAQNEKIEVIYNTQVKDVAGSGVLEKIILSSPYQGKVELAVQGLFIEVGSDPDLPYAQGIGLAVDEKGYVKINKDCSTNVAGVWAAGDITDGSDKFRQVITAAAEGAIAARSIFNWLKKQ